MRNAKVQLTASLADAIKSSGGAGRQAFARTLDRIDWNRDATAVGNGLWTVYKDGALITFRRPGMGDGPIQILDYRRDDAPAAVA